MARVGALYQVAAIKSLGRGQEVHAKIAKEGLEGNLIVGQASHSCGQRGLPSLSKKFLLLHVLPITVLHIDACARPYTCVPTHTGAPYLTHTYKCSLSKISIVSYLSHCFLEESQSVHIKSIAMAWIAAIGTPTYARWKLWNFSSTLVHAGIRIPTNARWKLRSFSHMWWCYCVGGGGR